MENYEKKYKEVLEKAKALYKVSEPMSGCNVIIETLFPELKEPEDEKIRKQIVNAIHDYAKRLEEKIPTEWLAWLERQGELPICNIPSKEIILAIWDLGNEWKELTNGCISTEYGTQLDYIQKHWHESEYYLRAMQNEQKLIDKDELKSKFKVGDWVVDKNGTIQQILSYKDGIYKHTNGYSSKMFEDEWRLWDITKDAKDGDVLATNDGNICIFDGTVKDGKYPFAYCGFTKHRFEFYDRRLPFTNNNIYPATKEQYDTLMKAMSNAGYTFDFEKKELKRIVQKPKENKGNIVEISSNWSEEDEENFCSVYLDVKSARQNTVNSLSGELKEQEQKRMDEVISWLKSLKGRVQSKQEWSEEDEQHIDSLLKRLDALCRNKFERTRFAISEDRDWLKSLRPQNRWKPSDEQIKVCKEVYADILSAKGFDLGTVVSELNRLEEGLKKKGE